MKWFNKYLLNKKKPCTNGKIKYIGDNKIWMIDLKIDWKVDTVVKLEKLVSAFDVDMMEIDQI